MLRLFLMSKNGGSEMNEKIKKLRRSNCYLTTAQIHLHDIILTTNTVIYYESASNIVYFCSKFPKNYKGKPCNIILHVHFYDFDTHELGATTLRNCEVSRELYGAWLDSSRPKPRKIVHEEDFEKLMKCDNRKKKSTTGGVRLMKDVDECVDFIRYRQVTYYAYIANMNDSRSGSASVVASGIR